MSKSNQNNQSPQQNQKDRLNTYAKYSSIGIQMFAIIGIGSYVGVRLDEHFANDNNLFTIILSFVSVILSIIYVIRRIIASSKDN